MQKLASYCSTILLSAAGAYGQGGGNAAITGTVTDPSGAVIAKANVVLTQMGTEVKRTATTNSSGQFNVPSLQPATYRVQVEAAGFKTYVQDVTLLADQIGSLQIPMQLGASAETVTVEATSTLVNTSGRTNVDTGLIKSFFPFASHEDLRFQLRGEFFNVLNHTELNDPEINVNSGNFGGIRAAADPRIIQLALKVFF